MADGWDWSQMIAVQPRGQAPANGSGILLKIRQMAPFPASHFQPIKKQERITEIALIGILALEKLETESVKLNMHSFVKYTLLDPGQVWRLENIL